jgi:hypothetical protein
VTGKTSFPVSVQTRCIDYPPYMGSKTVQMNRGEHIFLAHQGLFGFDDISMGMYLALIGPHHPDSKDGPRSLRFLQNISSGFERGGFRGLVHHWPACGLPPLQRGSRQSAETSHGLSPTSDKRVGRFDVP